MQAGNEVATKRDVLELEQRLEKRFAGIDQRFAELEQRFAELEQRFAEALHDTETKLLRAFYSFAEASQKHLADLDRSDSSFRERLGTLETRVTEIEKRLNMPGPQAAG